MTSLMTCIKFLGIFFVYKKHCDLILIDAITTITTTSQTKKNRLIFLSQV